MITVNYKLWIQTVMRHCRLTGVESGRDCASVRERAVYFLLKFELKTALKIKSIKKM